jgi:inner membrane protein
MQVNLGSSLSTTLKIFLIGAIVLILQLPLSMLGRLMAERVALREQAYEKVASGWGGKLVVGGPMLVVPTQYEVTENGVAKTHRESVYILPEQLDATVSAQQEAQPRYVGIYSVPVFIADVKLAASFDLQAQQPVLESRYPDRTFLWQQATLRLPVSEVRSLRQLGSASFDGQALSFSPLSLPTSSLTADGAQYLNGLEAPVRVAMATRPGDAALAASEVRKFELQLKLAGSRELAVIPVGSTTQVHMHSDWPHPSFSGAFLPAQRTITSAGFDASWQVLALNRSYGQVFTEAQLQPLTLLSSALGVTQHQSIDVYQRGERAIKYAALFIALTFLTFFAWEHLTRTRLHPLQYLLVGLALSIFYLLLIALSEHIAFVVAYWIAAAALIALIGAYLAGALRARRRGAVAGAVMTLVYGVLYMLVISEDYALLMGAIVLFVILGAVMLATRHVDWYGAAAAADDPA